MGDSQYSSLTTFNPSEKLVQIEHALTVVGSGQNSINPNIMSHSSAQEYCFNFVGSGARCSADAIIIAVSLLLSSPINLTREAGQVLDVRLMQLDQGAGLHGNQSALAELKVPSLKIRNGVRPHIVDDSARHAEAGSESGEINVGGLNNAGMVLDNLQ